MKRMFSLLILFLATFVFAACDFIQTVDIDPDLEVESIIFHEGQLEPNYEAGTFTVTGLQITVIFTDGTEQNINITNAMVSGLNALENPGTHTITVTYEGNTTSFDVVIVEPDTQPPVLTSIHVASDQLAANYEIGSFDVTALNLTLVYDDDSEETIPITTAMASGLAALTNPGTHTITITYNNLQTTFDVVIVEPDPTKTLTSISVSPTQLSSSYEVGAFDVTTLVLTLIYSDQTEETIPITTAMASGLAALANPGTHTITITYNNLQTTFDVVIVETEPEKTLTSISVNPTQLASSYEVGEFDVTTLLLTLIYSDESEETITIITGMASGLAALANPGTHTITITYKNLQTTFDVVVVEPQTPPSEKEAAADEMIDNWAGTATIVNERINTMMNADALTITLENITIINDDGFMETMHHTVEITFLYEDGDVYLWIVETIDLGFDTVHFEQLFVLKHDSIDVYVNLEYLLPMIEAEMEEEGFNLLELFDVEFDWFKLTIDDTMQSIIELDLLETLFELYELDIYLENALSDMGIDPEELDLYLEELEVLITSALDAYLPHLETLTTLLDEEMLLSMDKTEDFLVVLAMDMNLEIFAGLIAELLMETYDFIIEHELEDPEYMALPPNEAQILELIEILPMLEMEWIFDPLNEDIMSMYIDLSPFYNMVMDMEGHTLIFEEVSFKVTFERTANIELPTEYNDVHRIITEFSKLMILADVFDPIDFVLELGEGVHTLREVGFYVMAPIYDLDLSTYTITEDDVIIEIYYIDGRAVFSEAVSFEALSDIIDEDMDGPNFTREEFETLLELFDEENYHLTRFIVLLIAEIIYNPPFDGGNGYEETLEQQFVHYALEVVYAAEVYCNSLDFESPEYANYCVSDGFDGAAYYLTEDELLPHLWIPLPPEYNYAIWRNEMFEWELIVYSDDFEYYGPGWSINEWTISPRSGATLEDLIEFLDWENRSRPTE